MIIYILFFLIVGITYYFIKEQNKFNHNSELVQIQDPNKSIISEKMLERNPLLIHNLNSEELSNISIKYLIQNNPGYIINDNEKYISLDAFDNDASELYIFNNSKMIKDFNLLEPISKINDIFKNDLSCNFNYSLNLLKGDHKISLKKNKHSYLLLTQLFGESTIYLINPKHTDIHTRTFDESKKWAFKINLRKGVSLYIPSEWFFMYETQKESIMISSYCDNYFTFLYNYLR